MTHIITSLCLRDSSCVEVCPVECIIPGKPMKEWPWYYIDPETCIDCGACIPECPYEAIFEEEAVPADYNAKGGEYIARTGLQGHYEGKNDQGKDVILDCTKQLEVGEMVDLTEDIQPNYGYFTEGVGYDALDMQDEEVVVSEVAEDDTDQVLEAAAVDVVEESDSDESPPGPVVERASSIHWEIPVD